MGERIPTDVSNPYFTSDSWKTPTSILTIGGDEPVPHLGSFDIQNIEIPKGEKYTFFTDLILSMKSIEHNLTE